MRKGCRRRWQARFRARVEITPFFVSPVFEGELFLPAYYATLFRSGGNLSMRFYMINSAGTPVQMGSVNTTGSMEEAAAAPLGVGGLMSARRAPDGSVELIAWEARRNANNTISQFAISQHTAPNSGSLDFAGVPTMHAEGDYVTAVTDATLGLRLRGYRSGDRPF